MNARNIVRRWRYLTGAFIVAVNVAGSGVKGAPVANDASLAVGGLWIQGSAGDDPGACCTSSMCTEMTEGNCIAACGFWLAETSCPQINPVNPCERGSCCIGPMECVDNDGVGITDSACVTIWEGRYVGGARCVHGPCLIWPENDDCENATVVREIYAWPTYYPVNNHCATDDGPAHTNCFSDGGDLTYDVWYTYTTEWWGILAVSSCPPAPEDEPLVDFDQMIAVYADVPHVCAGDLTTPCRWDQQCDPHPGGPCVYEYQSLTQEHEVACNNDGCGQAGGAAEIEVDLGYGEDVLIRVGGWETDPPSGGAQGQGEILIELAGYC